MTGPPGASLAGRGGAGLSPERVLYGIASPGEAERFLAAIVASSDDAIIGTTLDGVITSWNAGAERIYGYAADEVLGRPIGLLVLPGCPNEMPRILERLRRGERVERHETEHVGKEGGRVPISLTVSLIEDETGAIVGASAIARDISERKRAEEQRELLLAELSHRVRNTLAVVQAIAERTADGAATVPEFLATFRGRLHALAAANAVLTQEDWRGASLARVARTALEPYLAGGDDRVRLEAEDVPLKPAAAFTLALALHELATNAGKYGALSAPTGRVVVNAGVEPGGGAADGGELRVEWREEGGPLVREPAETGFGTSLLVQAVEYQHEGQAELLWRRQGLICRLRLPLAEALLGPPR